MTANRAPFTPLLASGWTGIFTTDTAPFRSAVMPCLAGPAPPQLNRHPADWPHKILETFFPVVEKHSHRVLAQIS